jgi:Arc/MetJ-type ribon-helix-helix transcriptional regulator
MKVITINLPNSLEAKIGELNQELRDTTDIPDIYISRSNWFREALDAVLPILKELQAEMPNDEMVIRTINLGRDVLDEMENYYVNYEFFASRSELVRFVGLYHIIETLKKKKEEAKPIPKTFDEELTEYVKMPVQLGIEISSDQNQYKNYRIVKG